jgi:hypothetical protein
MARAHFVISWIEQVERRGEFYINAPVHAGSSQVDTTICAVGKKQGPAQKAAATNSPRHEARHR